MPPPKTSPGDPAGSASTKSGSIQGRPLPRLEACPIIAHGEVSSRIEQGGCLRGVVLEAQEDEPHPRYAAFLLSSWRREYTVLGFGSAERPRLFRDLDRMLALVRTEYAFKGTVALRLANDGPPRQHSWRITHGSNFSRSTAVKRPPGTRRT